MSAPTPLPTTEPAGAAHCLNCARPFGAEAPRFCPACGQDTRERAPTLRDFARQFTGAYLSSEGALWRTLALLLRPGRLTTEYLAGRRRRYVLPVRLFLSASLLTLLLLRLAAPSTLEPDAIRFDAGDAKGALITFGQARAGVKNGQFFCEELPAWLCRRLERRIVLDPKGLAREIEHATGRFFSHFGSALLVLVPLFAAFTALSYLGRGLRYAEHLVFALHVHTAWFVLLAFTVFGTQGIGGLAVLAMPLYHLMAARHVYGGGWWGTALRAAFVALAYGLTLGVALGVVAITTFLG